MQRANHIEIDSDEDGFFLMVYPDDGPRQDFRIEGLQERLYDQAKARIGPYLRERDEARRSLPVAFMCNPDESGGLTYERGVEAREEFDAYERSDPKHPAFHSTHADIWDARCTK